MRDYDDRTNAGRKQDGGGSGGEPTEGGTRLEILPELRAVLGAAVTRSVQAAAEAVRVGPGEGWRPDWEGLRHVVLEEMLIEMDTALPGPITDDPDASRAVGRAVEDLIRHAQLAYRAARGGPGVWCQGDVTAYGPRWASGLHTLPAPPDPEDVLRLVKGRLDPLVTELLEHGIEVVDPLAWLGSGGDPRPPVATEHHITGRTAYLTPWTEGVDGSRVQFRVTTENGGATLWRRNAEDGEWREVEAHPTPSLAQAIRDHCIREIYLRQITALYERALHTWRHTNI